MPPCLKYAFQLNAGLCVNNRGINNLKTVINQAVSASELIAQGDMQTKVSIMRSDEFGRLYVAKDNLDIEDSGVKASAKSGKGRWTANLTIPFAALGVRPEAGLSKRRWTVPRAVSAGGVKVRVKGVQSVPIG